MPPASVCSILGLDESLLQSIEGLVDWFAPDPQPVFWATGASKHLPEQLRQSAYRVLHVLPERYVERAGRYYEDFARSADELRWRAFGFLVEDARAPRFRAVLTGLVPDPLTPDYESAGVVPDNEGLIQSRWLTGTRGNYELGAYDVELSRSTTASNSTYWLAPCVLGRPSCKMRLDPLRFAPRGTLTRCFYAMVVYGPPFDWKRILKLRQTEIVQWMADKGDHAEPDLLTELAWKPLDSEVILEVEELPRQNHADLDGARYLHAVLDREREQFTHLDGVIRWYNHEELASRRTVRQHRTGSAGLRTKIFRLDEPIGRDDALDILSAFFVWNNDVVRYFDPSSPLARFSRSRQVQMIENDRGAS